LVVSIAAPCIHGAIRSQSQIVADTCRNLHDIAEVWREGYWDEGIRPSKNLSEIVWSLQRKSGWSLRSGRG
jgi:hypothetical protein